jgi:single-strand DNA-binding protein
MPSLNRVFLIGNLTREVELRYTPKGTPVAEIGVAINRVWTDEENRKREEATFVEVTFWARLAEIAEQYLHKGGPAIIEGRLHLDTWEDKQTGQKRSRLRVIGENLQLLGNKENDRAPTAPATPSKGSAERPGVPEPDFDDAPF